MTRGGAPLLAITFRMADDPLVTRVFEVSEPMEKPSHCEGFSWESHFMDLCDLLGRIFIRLEGPQRGRHG
jgi:hypothetical protein